MLNRSIKLTSEEYRKVLEVAEAVEAATGYRPSFSQVIGMAISNYNNAPQGGHHDDGKQGERQRI